MWAADSGQKVTILDGNHPGPTQCVKFNPKFMTMTTACTNIVSFKFIKGMKLFMHGSGFRFRCQIFDMHIRPDIKLTSIQLFHYDVKCGKLVLRDTCLARHFY